MSKPAKVIKGRAGDHERDSKPTTQKQAQARNNNKIREIMSTFSASKPTNVDAQRIVCVLDALIEKIAILEYLDSDLFNSLNEKTRSQEKEDLLAQLSNQTHTLLGRELDLEIKLKPLLGGQDSIDKTADESGPVVDFAGMVSTTAKNLRNLIRELQNNPHDMEILKRLRKNTPLEDYEDFLNYLRGLRVLMLRRLSTSVEEQASHDRQKEELNRKILLWERTKNNKENELKSLKKEKENYIKEKDEELAKLKHQIDDIEANKKKKMTDLEGDSKKEQDAMKKAFEEKEAQLMKQLKVLEDDLKELRAKNKAEENSLRDKNLRGEDYLKEIINNYDEMLEDSEYDAIQDGVAPENRRPESKEQEIMRLETELQKIEKEIRDYQENLTSLKAEEEKEKEIEKKIAAKREYHESEHERINKIVQAIQDAWKAYKIKAKPKKKKKGKKDGKNSKR